MYTQTLSFTAYTSGGLCMPMQSSPELANSFSQANLFELSAINFRPRLSILQLESQESEGGFYQISAA